MTDRNVTIAKGKDVDGRDVQLDICLADEHREVRGFGRPVTAMFAKQMAQNFYSEIESINTFVSKMLEDQDERLVSLKQSAGFKSLLDLIDPERMIVSGVFGKETILRLLSQRDCEGIRYVFGKDEKGKMTIVLLGVRQIEGESVNEDGVSVAMSKPLGPEDFYKNKKNYNDTDPEHDEVHKASLTVKQLKLMLNLKVYGSEEASDVIFGIY